jgi:hypothetical protein
MHACTDGRAANGRAANGRTDRHLQDYKHKDNHYYFSSSQEKQYQSTNTGCNKLVTGRQQDGKRTDKLDKLTKHEYDGKVTT